MENTQKTRVGGFYDWVKRAPETSVTLALIVMVAVMAFASPYFMRVQNLVNILQQASITGIVGVGVAFVAFSGGVDISVGSTLSLGGVVAAKLLEKGVNCWIGVAVGLLCGLIAGYINGVVIVKCKLSPFIVTIGTQNIIRGIAFIISDGLAMPYICDASYLGGGKIGIVPFSVVIMIALVIIAHVYARKTRFGRYYFAVGCNENSARMSGVNSDAVRISSFVIVGFCAALAGIVNAGNIMIADTATGSTTYLDCICAVSIGGVSLAGGTGSMVGMLLGALLMCILKNAFVLLQISAYAQMVATGVLVIAAVLLDVVRNRKR